MRVKKDSGFSQSAVMADLLTSSAGKIPSLRRGQEVSGKIVGLSNSEALVDIGAKSEGIIAGREFTSGREMLSQMAVGDTIEATVMYPENDAGQVVLSLRKLSGEKRWQELEEKKADNEEVEVVAMEANRGGLICDFVGLRGFLPSSQLSKVPSKLEDLIGKSMQVHVIEVDRATNRLIFSQKMPGKKDLGELLKLLAKVKIGDKYEGIVTAILPFGAFVEIDLSAAGPVSTFPPASARSSKKSNVGKVDDVELRAVGSPSSTATRSENVSTKLEGLVHISEISWEKVDDVSKVFKVGDVVSVLVIAKDSTTGRLNLSIKQLTTDPFAEATAKYTKDMKVSGIVAKVTPYGVFVELEDNIEGLIHISKIPPNVSINEGDKIECEIDSIDVSTRKIALVPIVTEKPVLYR